MISIKKQLGPDNFPICGGTGQERWLPDNNRLIKPPMFPISKMIGPESWFPTGDWPEIGQIKRQHRWELRGCYLGGWGWGWGCWAWDEYRCGVRCLQIQPTRPGKEETLRIPGVPCKRISLFWWDWTTTMHAENYIHWRGRLRAHSWRPAASDIKKVAATRHRIAKEWARGKQKLLIHCFIQQLLIAVDELCSEF